MFVGYCVCMDEKRRMPQPSRHEQHDERADDELVGQILRGTPQERDAASLTLYNRYHRKVFREVMSVMFDENRAEEVAQEVILEAIQKIENYRPTSSFAAWLRSIAHARAIDSQRKEHGDTRRQRRRAKISLDSLEEHERDHLLHRRGLEAIDEDDRAELVSGALSILHGQLLTVVEMTLDGKKLKEIGRELGVTESRVCQILTDARARMRKHIENASVPLPVVRRTKRDVPEEDDDVLTKLMQIVDAQLAQATKERIAADERVAIARKRLEDEG